MRMSETDLVGGATPEGFSIQSVITKPVNPLVKARFHTKRQNIWRDVGGMQRPKTEKVIRKLTTQ